MTISAISIAMVAAAVLGVVVIKDIGNKATDRILLLLCETGEKNLDAYFKSVEQSVKMVTAYVEADLDGLDADRLGRHLTRARDIFKKLSHETNGIVTYYYRIDPSVSESEKGFWYVNLDGKGFEEHEVTDITQYDTENTSALVWFTVPKATGRPVWLPPYITDNLDVRVISYNEPIYYDGTFVGVVGIEIDYSTMADVVDSITLFDSGYAFINDKEGTIVYHPKMSIEELSENHPKVPEGLLSEDKFIHYNYLAAAFKRHAPECYGTRFRDRFSLARLGGRDCCSLRSPADYLPHSDHAPLRPDYGTAEKADRGGQADR